MKIQMTRFLKVISGMILLALFFSVGIVCAADEDADLNVTKVVSSTGPYKPGDEITWVVTLWNNGPGHATNISLSEDVSELSGLVTITGVADQGEYNNITRIWNISRLENATFTTLTLISNFDTPGEKTNSVDITALDQTDPELNDNHAKGKVLINTAAVVQDTPLAVNLAIRPTTLNLNSKGIFTVYLSLSGTGAESGTGENIKSRIDYAKSSLTCSDAGLIRATVSNRDGGTLIAKFHRYDLENVTSGDGVKINCSGSLWVNGKSLNAEGSDTIRVIGEKKGLDKVLSRLWKFLGIEKEDIEVNESEDGNVTVTLSLNPDNFRNTGQAKKVLKNQNNGSDTESVNETAVSDQTRGRKESQSKNNGDTKQIKEKNTGNKPEKDNNGSDNRNEESMGKANGKKTK